MNTMPQETMTEELAAEFLIELLEAEGHDAETFRDAGIMAHNTGIVFTDSESGTSFQITIVEA